MLLQQRRSTYTPSFIMREMGRHVQWHRPFFAFSASLNKRNTLQRLPKFAAADCQTRSGMVKFCYHE
jgi:hypothetical protein